MNNSDAIMDAFIDLCDGDMEECAEKLRREFSFDPMARLPIVEGKKTETVSNKNREDSGERIDSDIRMAVFIRDGFLDRISGDPVVLPAVLKLISHNFPELFPHQLNWRMGQTHIAYYEMCACTNKIDHTKEGRYGPEELITTTMPYVMARSRASIESMGWEMKPVGDINEWDGLSRMFRDHIADNPELKKLSFVRTWYPAVKRAFMD